jgi:hypothetical protein
MRKAGQVVSRSRFEALRATAYHEAGHAMAAWYFEIPFGKGKHVLSIVPEGTTQGHFLSKYILRGRRLEVSTTGADRLKMERVVVVLLAGMVAQRKHRPSSVRSWQGSSDFHSAVNLVSYFAASGRETEAYLKLLRIRAELTLERPGAWECVEAIATALLDRKTLCAKEVVEIVQATHARLLEDHYKSRCLPLPWEQPDLVSQA